MRFFFIFFLEIIWVCWRRLWIGWGCGEIFCSFGIIIYVEYIWCLCWLKFLFCLRLFSCNCDFNYLSCVFCLIYIFLRLKVKFFLCIDFFGSCEFMVWLFMYNFLILIVCFFCSIDLCNYFLYFKFLIINFRLLYLFFVYDNVVLENM